jgi:DNA polymerase-4
MDDKDRIILHCDMNAFYASVELLSRPELAERPVAVCGDPEKRHGIILAKNEPAKRYGVVTAETVGQARRKCPDLLLLPAHHDKYRRYSKQINDIYARFTDMIEPFSIDESWLDVTAVTQLFGTGSEIAHTIKSTVFAELGLTQSIGVSWNKIFAKMGSEYRKPNAVTVIDRENYKDILWPLPVRELFSVGRATAEKLYGMGVHTIGDLAAADRRTLQNIFGKQGNVLYEYANGLENAPVRAASERRKIKSVGNGITFKRDLLGKDDILTALTALSDTVSSRLRKYGLKCGGVKVEVKDTNFKTVSRQVKLSAPTNLAEHIRNAAADIMHRTWSVNAPIRLITITGIDIVGEDSPVQTSLLDDMGPGAEKSETLERTMDKIRGKYGGASITYGRIIGNDIGIELDEQCDDEDTGIF